MKLFALIADVVAIVLPEMIDILARHPGMVLLVLIVLVLTGALGTAGVALGAVLMLFLAACRRDNVSRKLKERFGDALRKDK